MKIVFLGSYDTGKPRTRILLRGLREIGINVIECHADVWSGVEDKSRITGRLKRLVYLLRLLAVYPALIWRYLRLPPHDLVVMAYPAQLDALLLGPLVRLRRTPLVIDLVQSAYVSVVKIRRMLQAGQPMARLLFLAERRALRAADRVIFLSSYAAQQFGQLFGLDAGRVGTAMIGVEPEYFPPTQDSGQGKGRRKSPVEVLFYGSFHKLHGVDRIVEAARLGQDLPINWTLIGSGQEAEHIQREIDAAGLRNIVRIPWVAYPELVDRLHDCDIALGLLGQPGETGWAIPNKLFQMLHAGIPTITADTPAVRELLGSERLDLRLVPAGDAQALLDAVVTMARQLEQSPRPRRRHLDLIEKIQPRSIAEQFVKELDGLVAEDGGCRCIGAAVRSSKSTVTDESPHT